MDKGNILPDCRMTDRRSTSQTMFGMSVPVFCANCGVYGCDVPQDSTFVFWLCNKCAETYGQIAGTMMMPDEVFFENVRQEQLEKHKRLLTEQELLVVVDEDASSLAKLLKERPR